MTPGAHVRALGSWWGAPPGAAMGGFALAAFNFNFPPTNEFPF